MSSTSRSTLRSVVSGLARSLPGTRAHRNRPQPTSDQGLTLIECLVAIIVITITVVAITPPIMLATASRVQSRRAAQANQVAQGEVDRIRLLVERSDQLSKYAEKDLPASAGTTIKDVPAATVAPSGAPSAASPLLTSNSTCTTEAARYPFQKSFVEGTPTQQLPVANLVRVDINNDCTPEYVMQVFRAEDQSPTTGGLPLAFKVGVRVYSYFPDQSFPILRIDQRASLNGGTGAGDRMADGSRRPLAVLYTTIARSGSSATLCQIRKQANSADPCIP